MRCLKMAFREGVHMKVFTPQISPDGSVKLRVDELAEVPPIASAEKVSIHYKMVVERDGVWRRTPFVEANATVVQVDHGEMKTPAVLSLAEKLGIPVVRL